MRYRLPFTMRGLSPYLCSIENMPGPRTIMHCRFHRRLRTKLLVNASIRKTRLLRDIRLRTRKLIGARKTRRFQPIFNRPF